MTPMDSSPFGSLPLDGAAVKVWTPYDWVSAADHLYRGGFRYGKGLVTMLAIAEAESNRGTYRLGPLGSFSPPTLRLNADGTYDRSWLMINSVHVQWTDEDLADPVAAARAAFAITKEGESFGPYVVWRTHAFQKHMDVARYAVATHAYIVLGMTKVQVVRIANFQGVQA